MIPREKTRNLALKQMLSLRCLSLLTLPTYAALTTVAQKPSIVVEQAISSYSFQVL
jgi:hypothetical protein